jgi:hypothetical protein
LSNSSHFPVIENSEGGEAGQVAPWVGQALHHPSTDRIGKVDEYDWDGTRFSPQYYCRRCRPGYDHIRCEADKLHCISSRAVEVAVRPAKFEVNIASFGPTEFLKAFL